MIALEMNCWISILITKDRHINKYVLNDVRHKIEKAIISRYRTYNNVSKMSEPELIGSSKHKRLDCIIFLQKFKLSNCCSEH